MNKLVIFGLSANPPANHHLLIISKLKELYEKVVVIPRGTGSNKPSTNSTSHDQRKEMVQIVFGKIPDVDIDFYDLDNNIFTPTWLIDQKYKALYPDLEIWHAIGGDLVKGGSTGESEIEIKWQKGSEIWSKLNWLVISSLNCPVNPDDLPPHNNLLKMDHLEGRSTTIRERVAANQTITDLVPPETEQYIIKNNLYKKNPLTSGSCFFSFSALTKSFKCADGVIKEILTKTQLIAQHHISVTNVVKPGYLAKIGTRRNIQINQ